ncbi:hypothetical protein [Flavobacterium tegetincola]|uniref:hypothetical protein n=1 Tax=Flavobacterium tegetincola TaxID=150172 RepID=UPI0003FD8C7D|nr:hypothetical protein [Flavobacterium tegetincola]
MELNSIFLGIVLVIWVVLAIYLLIDTRKKVKLLGEKFNIFYPFQCGKCNKIKNYSYTEFMQIVKKPRNKFTTFKGVRDQYLFYCEECNKNEFQEILYQQIPSNPEFVKENRKIILLFFLKEFAVGILVTAIVGLSGMMPQ